MNFFKKTKEDLKRILEGPKEKVKIGRRYVGVGEPTFVIAEIGINHNGDMEIAKKLILEAKKAGADAVKFQKRTTTEILTKEGLEKPYDSPNAFAPTYGEHREKLEFSKEKYRELKKFAESIGILFFASVWDNKSADFMEELNIDAYKIPSADTTNLPLLDYVAQKGKPILLSTGMNTFEEIEEAIHTVLKKNNKLILFHCLSLYPSPHEKINLSFMNELRRLFPHVPVGYSGHEIDMLPTLVAVARGASVIERHFTLDKKMKGGDHAASLEPNEMKELVGSIKEIGNILGEPKKIMYEELKPLREKLAKSVVTKVPIKAGTKITKEMLGVKGPGSGIKPKDANLIIGKIAKRDLNADIVVPTEVLFW